MPRIDIMVDIETLGVSSRAQIIQLSAYAFDIASGNLYDVPFITHIKVPENAIIDGSTLKWWLNTSPDLLKQLITSATIDEKTALLGFADWCNTYAMVGDLHLWGNGILFDNKIIKDKMESYGIQYPIFYRRDRDVRTLVDLYCARFNVTEDDLKKRFEGGVAHNATDDVLYQIRYVTHCYNALIGK